MSEILIFAEIEEGDLHSTAGELIAAGRKISDDTGDSVSVAIIGGNQDLGSKATDTPVPKIPFEETPTHPDKNNVMNINIKTLNFIFYL